MCKRGKKEEVWLKVESEKLRMMETRPVGNTDAGHNSEASLVPGFSCNTLCVIREELTRSEGPIDKSISFRALLYGGLLYSLITDTDVLREPPPPVQTPQDTDLC